MLKIRKLSASKAGVFSDWPDGSGMPYFLGHFWLELTLISVSMVKKVSGSTLVKRTSNKKTLFNRTVLFYHGKKRIKKSRMVWEGGQGWIYLPGVDEESGFSRR